MSETIEDMKNMFINNIGGTIVIDVSGCRLGHSKQIALRNIIRLQSKINSETVTKSVQVKISEAEQRSFKVPSKVNGKDLHSDILSDLILMNFTKL